MFKCKIFASDIKYKKKCYAKKSLVLSLQQAVDMGVKQCSVIFQLPLVMKQAIILNSENLYRNILFSRIQLLHFPATRG